MDTHLSLPKCSLPLKFGMYEWNRVFYLNIYCRFGTLGNTQKVFGVNHLGLWTISDFRVTHILSLGKMFVDTWIIYLLFSVFLWQKAPEYQQPKRSYLPRYLEGPMEPSSHIEDRSSLCSSIAFCSTAWRPSRRCGRTTGLDLINLSLYIIYSPTYTNDFSVCLVFVVWHYSILETTKPLWAPPDTGQRVSPRHRPSGSKRRCVLNCEL